MVKQQQKGGEKVWDDAPFTSALTSGLTGSGAGSATTPAASARSMKDRLVAMRIVMDRYVSTGEGLPRWIG